jgi:hypothetical protein
MDDRFDRRELLLHLGDMLEALSCLASTGRPEAPARQLTTEQDSLQGFEFLRALSLRMTVTEFGGRVASAFFLWSKELLDMELSRNASRGCPPKTSGLRGLTPLPRFHKYT